MKEVNIFRNFENARRVFGPCVLTIGNFDGVHVGHQAILARVGEVSRLHGARPSVLTFYPHPARILRPELAPLALTSHAEKCALMGAAGIEQVMLMRFTPALAQLEPEDFVRKIIVEGLQAKAVLVGENFRFGRDQSGDCSVLQSLSRKYGFSFEPVPFHFCRREVVSSSRIRSLLAAGSVNLISRPLRRFYSVTGHVVRGHGIGRSQTVPTLNLRPARRALPKIGVYVTQTASLPDARTWPSVTNIGYRPTFDGTELTIETHLLTPISGSTPDRISVAFLRRLREERRFDSPEDLKTQIICDVQRAQAYHRRLNRWARAPFSRLSSLEANTDGEILCGCSISGPNLYDVKLKFGAS